MLMRYAEKMLATVSPQRALRRSVARLQLQEAQRLETLSRMDAAKRDRTTADWPSQPVGPLAAIALDAPTINARARHAKDNTWQGAAIASGVRRSVNNTGITPRSRATLAAGEPQDKAQRQRLRELRRRLDRSYRAWARDPRRCDVEERETLNDKINLIIEDRKFVGAGFLVWSLQRPTAGSATAPLRVQGFEWEQLDRSKDTVRPQQNGHVIRGGLETDANGKLVAFHVHLRSHPQEDFLMPGSATAIRADRVLMYCRRTRSGQAIPPSELSPVLLKLWRNNQYDEHEQVAKQIESFIAFAIQTDPRYGPPNLGTPTKPTPGTATHPTATNGGDTDDSSSPTYRELNLGPGMVPELMPGEEIKMMQPTRPGPQYDGYMKTQAKMIASGTDMSAARLTRDFAGTYVNGRMTVNEDEKVDDLWQQQAVDYLLRPLRNLYTTLCVLYNIDGIGDLAPDYFDSEAAMLAYQECEWMPPRRKPIDPAKQAAADAINLEYFLTHRGEILNERNLLVEDVFADINIQQELAAEFDIPLPELLAALQGAPEGGTKADQSKPKTHGTGDGGAQAAASAGRGMVRSLVSRVVARSIDEE